MLVKVADSVLLAIDEAIEMPLALERLSRSTNYSRNESLPVTAVDSEYDPKAMSLYWSAKTASSMPLIQFLAYYQVIEFYFDRYWKKDTWKAMRKVLEHPRFDPYSDSDIGRLFRAANVNPNPKDRALRPSERVRLKATIQECVTLYDLRSFIVDSEDRQRFFGSNRAKRISRRTISIGDMSSYSLDHREEAAERLSDIRNRIVHAREGQEPLLPSAPEIGDLRHDIDLVEFLARKVLRASASPLRV